MHNKINIITLLIGLTFCTAHAGNHVCSRQGAITVCGSGELNDLHVAGKASLSGTTVVNNTQIAGLLLADKVRLNTFQLSGKAVFDRSVISGNSKISGLLEACNSKFSQIKISSDRVHLNNVITKNIQIEPGGEQQVICLTNNSLIEGNINFSSGNGLIVMDDSSKILGHIAGGVVNKKYIKLYCEGVQTC